MIIPKNGFPDIDLFLFPVDLHLQFPGLVIDSNIEVMDSTGAKFCDEVGLECFAELFSEGFRHVG